MPSYFLAECPKEALNLHESWNTSNTFKGHDHRATDAAAVFLSNFQDTVELLDPSIVDSVILEQIKQKHSSSFSCLYFVTYREELEATPTHMFRWSQLY